MFPRKRESSTCGNGESSQLSQHRHQKTSSPPSTAFIFRHTRVISESPTEDGIRVIFRTRLHSYRDSEPESKGSRASSKAYGVLHTLVTPCHMYQEKPSAAQ